ncbi:hypothetical protein ACB094_04G108000 [Castanea mollissima]
MTQQPPSTTAPPIVLKPKQIHHPTSHNSYLKPHKEKPKSIYKKKKNHTHDVKLHQIVTLQPPSSTIHRNRATAVHQSARPSHPALKSSVWREFVDKPALKPSGGGGFWSYAVLSL